MLEHFQQQLLTAPINNGDYYNGRTRSDVIKGMCTFYNNNKVIDAQTLNERAQFRSISEIEQLIDSKITEWQNHIGEQLLFYMVQINDNGSEILQVRKSWSNSVVADLNGMVFDRMSTTGDMPIFKLA